MLTLKTESEVPFASKPVSPLRIFETLNLYQHTLALKGAIELDVFTLIAAGASTSSEIARRCNAAERGVRILCDLLTIMGFLRKTADRYQLTPESAAFLDKNSPAYFGSVAQFIASPAMIDKFRDVPALVRNGGSQDDLEQPADKWVEFARLTTPMVALAAKATAAVVATPGSSQKVLDIAAGSGMFGLSIAQLNPKAQIVAMDWANVLEVAKANAHRFHVEDQLATVSGNVFETDMGSGYDVVLVPNFLHHFDALKNVELLKKIHAALNPAGRIAIVEFVPNDDRVTPAVAAAFSFTMLGHSPSGEAYTWRELNGMLHAAGFGEARRQDLLPTPLTLLLASA
jgi:2-polyprenyl-3-methyl-5-hydroxy-6-metoxy-1,4-benzoquinol methylase